MTEDGRIKILQIIGNTGLSGVVSCVLNYMECSDLKKYRFDFVTYAPSPAFDNKVKSLDGNAEIYYIPSFKKNPIKAAVCLNELCHRENYAAVHSHLTILSAIALPPCKSAGVPVRICHAHSTFNRHSDKFLIKKLMRPFATLYATHLAACSHTAAENTFRKKANEAFILPNAIKAERFYCTKAQHEEAKKQCGLTGTTALFTGRFEYQKNLKFLLEAFSKAGRSDMQLVLLGEGTQYEELKKNCENLGITGRVKFVPQCNPDVWYKAADVFCLPSLYEGLSISAIEAQSAGLPCLFSDAVSAETDITGNCTFLKTEQDIWANAFNGVFERDYSAKDKIISAGYDINYVKNNLTDYYDNIIGDRK